MPTVEAAVEIKFQGGAVPSANKGGIGWALNEEYVYGADGRIQNANWPIFQKWGLTAIFRIERIREHNTYCSRKVIYAHHQPARRRARSCETVAAVARSPADRELPVPRP